MKYLTKINGTWTEVRENSNMFLTREQIWMKGFKTLGENVLIDEAARFYGTRRISIGNNVRIDAFAVISAGDGGIILGDYVHIACHSSIQGAGEIHFEEFSALSMGGRVLSSNADYSGEYLTNPTVPMTVQINGAPLRLRTNDDRRVYIGRHVVIGSNSLVLPGAIIGDGSIVGALSMVKEGVYEKSSILAGVPAKKIRDRKTNIFQLAKLLK